MASPNIVMPNSPIAVASTSAIAVAASVSFGFFRRVDKYSRTATHKSQRNKPIEMICQITDIAKKAAKSIASPPRRINNQNSPEINPSRLRQVE